MTIMVITRIIDVFVRFIIISLIRAILRKIVEIEKYHEEQDCSSDSGQASGESRRVKICVEQSLGSDLKCADRDILRQIWRDDCPQVCVTSGPGQGQGENYPR